MSHPFGFDLCLYSLVFILYTWFVAIKSFSTPAIILKRSDIGEADRVVTIYTKDQGKIVCIAKGVRKLTSSKKSLLEPGNLIQAFLIKTKSLPLLTQARIITDYAALRQELVKIRQLTQVLEMVDKLYIEEEDPQLFAMTLKVLDLMVNIEKSNGHIKLQLEKILVYLGYQPLSESGYQTVSEYVSSIIEKPMHSFEYLSIDHKS